MNKLKIKENLDAYKLETEQNVNGMQQLMHSNEKMQKDISIK